MKNLIAEVSQEDMTAIISAAKDKGAWERCLYKAVKNGDDASFTANFDDFIIRVADVVLSHYGIDAHMAVCPSEPEGKAPELSAWKVERLKEYQGLEAAQNARLANWVANDTQTVEMHECLEHASGNFRLGLLSMALFDEIFNIKAA